MVSAWAVLTVLAGSNWACEYSGRQWAPSHLAPPCVVLKGGARAAKLAAAKKQWALSDEQAACVLDAFDATADAGVQALRDDPRPLVNGSADGWRRCVDRWPDAFALWVGLIRAKEGGYVDVARLRDVPQGVDLATRLLPLEFGPSAGLASVILAKQPARLIELLSHPQVLGDDAFELALPMLDAAGTRTPPLTPTEWEAVALAALRTPLERGWLELAAEVWLQVPEATRKVLRARPLPSVTASFTGDELAIREEGDLRPTLALALVIAEKKDEARTIPLDRPDGGDDVSYRRGHVDGDTAVRVVDVQLGRQRIDAWDAALEARTARLPAEALVALVPFVAPYTALIQKHIEWTLDKEHGVEATPPAVSVRVEAAHARAVARLQAAWAKVKPGGADAGVTKDAGVADVTLPEAAWPFSIRATPWKGRAPVAVKPEVPRGLWPVRAERSGKRTVVLALSQRVDPLGEVSMGGYWLLVSGDGGRTWRELYLGFSDHRPFHAWESSKVPLLDEQDVVRLDVQEAALREETITFPPLGTQAPVTKEHVVLEAKLADVAKDSDGDGLTDLVEARLLLDPRRADTDGDGIDDRNDATPRLDDRSAPTPLAEVYNAFFEYFSEGKAPRALVVAPNSKGSMAAAVGTAKPVDLDQTRFVVADTDALGGLRPLGFVVTLTEAELAAAAKRFGAFYPMDLEVHASRDGKHGFVQWSERWRGGSMRFDREADGTWKVTELSGWIT